MINLELITEIKPRHSLTDEELNFINKYRKLRFEFDVITDWYKGDELNKDNFIFIVKSKENKIVSFGELTKIKIRYSNKDPDIYAIKDIVAVEQGKGYGMFLMSSIREFIEKSDFMGIGFCSYENTKFYEKCECGTVHDVTDRWLFKQADETFKPSEYEEKDLFYINEDPELVKILNDKNGEKVIAYQKQW